MRSDKVTGSFIKNLTRKAKELVKASGVPLHQAQDKVATEAGYENWRELKAIQKRSEDQCEQIQTETQAGVLAALNGGISYAEPIKKDFLQARWMTPGRIKHLPSTWVDIREAYGKPEYTKDVELALSLILSEPYAKKFSLNGDSVNALLRAFELAHGELSSYRARGYIHGPMEDIDIDYPFLDYSHRLWEIAGANKKEMAYLDVSALWSAHVWNVYDLDSVNSSVWLSQEEKAEKRKALKAAVKTSYKAYELFANDNGFEVKPPKNIVK